MTGIFRVCRNKEECNKRNRNIGYAIFRDSNLNRISNVLLNRPYFCDRFSKPKRLFPFLGPLFFLHFCQNEMLHFLENGSEMS